MSNFAERIPESIDVFKRFIRPEKAEFLLLRGSQPQGIFGELYTTGMKWALAGDVMRRESVRTRPEADIFSRERWQESGQQARIYAEESIQFYSEAAIADRAGNGYLLSLLARLDGENDSEYGFRLHLIREDPEYSDHGVPHERRFERIMEMLLFNVPELRHGSTAITKFLRSLYVNISMHDSPQIIRERQNRDFRNEIAAGLVKELDVKRLHGVEATLMMLVTIENYVTEGLVTREEATRIMAIAAVIASVHEEPELFAKRCQATMAADQFKSSKDLLKAWDNGDVNWLSMSGYDYCRLLKAGKKEIGRGVESEFGMDGSFEDEKWEELVGLKEDRRTIRELIGLDDSSVSISEAQLISAAEVFILSDLIDMLYPPKESIFKKFLSQYSRKRNFYEVSMSEDLIEMVMYGPGNVKGFDCDVRRTLWENYQALHLLRTRFGIGQYKFIDDFVFKAVKGSVYGFYKAGMELMQEKHVEMERGITRGGIIDRIYGERMGKMDDKMIKRRYRASDMTINHVALLLDRWEMRVALQSKPAGWKEYERNEVENFQRVMFQFINMFGITAAEREDFEVRWRRGERLVDGPYDSYDITIKPEGPKPKLLVPALDRVNQLREFVHIRQIESLINQARDLNLTI